MTFGVSRWEDGIEMDHEK